MTASTPRSGSRGLIIAGAIALVIVVVMRIGSSMPVSFPASSPPVLGVVDPRWTLESLDGKQLSFGSLAGRVVFVNIWATWCPPCVAEVPSIQDLYDSVKDRGVAVVLVTQEDPEHVRRFVAEKGWNVPVFIARDGIPQVFQCDAIPTTFIVNRRGEVVYQHTGGVDWNTSECREFLLGL
jgi:thiol-disulfide isomerase/thioredoxin